MAQRPSSRRPATLASLAAELGVSRTTVSNAYNRPDQLSPKLRQRVLEAARRLGYPGPDPLARSLRTRRTGAIGLLLTEALSYAFRDPAAVELLAGLAQAGEEARAGLLLVPAVPGAGSDTTLAASAAVDGFIVYSLPRDDPHLEAVLSRPLPTVIIDEPLGVPGIDFVGIDDRVAAEQAGAHLASLGHRDVAVICTRISSVRQNGLVSLERQLTSSYDVVLLRLEGLIESLGVYRPDVPVWECWDANSEAGEAAAHALLDAYPHLTAIACTTDMLALGAWRAARARGIDVPGQLSITGFDDVPPAAWDGLTTVRQLHAEKGREAWRLLSRGDRDQVPRRESIVPTELVLRASTGAAPR